MNYCSFKMRYLSLGIEHLEIYTTDNIYCLQMFEITGVAIY